MKKEEKVTENDLLNNEIRTLVGLLAMYSPVHDPDEYGNIVDNLTKLYKAKIEEDQNIRDNHERKIERYCKLGTDLTGIVLPLAVSGFWIGLGLVFEEKGVFTSQIFKWLYQRYVISKR